MKIENKLPILHIKIGNLYNSHKELTLVVPINYSDLLASWRSYLGAKSNYNITNIYQIKIFQLVSQKDEQINTITALIFKSRHKRGLMNVLGDILSGFTGVLSHDDGEQLEKQILELYDNQKLISDSPTGVLKVVNSSINNLVAQFNSQTTLLNHFLSCSANNQELADKIRYQLMYVQEVHDTLQTLLLGLSLTSNNVLYPTLIQPRKLLKEIRQVPIEKPFKFPYSLEMDTLLSLEKLFQVKYYINKSTVTFILQIPLITSDY